MRSIEFNLKKYGLSNAVVFTDYPTYEYTRNHMSDIDFDSLYDGYYCVKSKLLNPTTVDSFLDLTLAVIKAIGFTPVFDENFHVSYYCAYLKNDEYVRCDIYNTCINECAIEIMRPNMGYRYDLFINNMYKNLAEYAKDLRHALELICR